MKKITILLLLFITSFGFSQVWNLETSIQSNDPNSGYVFGQQMDMDSSGTVIAIGDMQDDEMGDDAGKIKVFHKIGDNWVQKGNDITGENMNDDWGINLALSRDGNNLITATERSANGGFFGYFPIYHFNGSIWQQTDTIIGNTNDRFSEVLSMNENGTVVAISGDRPDPSGDGSFDLLGKVSVFSPNGSGWELLGAPIIYEDPDPGNYFGKSLSLSADGHILAIGATYDSGTNNTTGLVRVYEYNGSSWVQKGNDIQGTTPYGSFGFKVSLNLAGNILAVSAFDAEQVSVYQFDGSDWVIMGNVIQGNESGFGRSIDLNDAGTDLAVGSFYKVKAYTFDGSDWVQVGPTIAPSPSPSFREDIGISNDAKTIGVSTFDESVWVYALSAPPQITAQPQDQSDICPGSTVDFSVTATNTLTYQWQVSTDNANTWMDITNNNTYSGADTNTLTVNVSVTTDNYQYRCQVSNTEGAQISDVAVLSLENDAPVIGSSPGDQTLDAGANCEAVMPDLTNDVVASDNCTSANMLSITQYPAAGDMVTDYTTATITVTDEAGNASTANFMIYVVDNTPPVFLSTHDDQVIDADDNCEASLPDYTIYVNADDNCFANFMPVQTPAPGTMISGDTNTVTLTIQDEAGNQASVSFNVSVEDNTPPEITYVDNQMVAATSPDGYTVQGTEFDIQDMSDNCGIASVVNDFNNQSTLDGALLPVGVTDITWTVTDNAGNETTNSFYVDVSPYVGIEDLTQAGISVSPNPFNESIRLDWGETQVQQVYLQDITGKTIWQSQVREQNMTIDTRNLQKGVYLLLISTEKGIMTAKLIKE